jgi:hypothetical protein
MRGTLDVIQRVRLEVDVCAEGDRLRLKIEDWSGQTIVLCESSAILVSGRPSF